MAKFEYEDTVVKSVDVEPCPCCGSDDIRFSNEDGDTSMYSACGSVSCNVCGHKVKVEGSSLDMSEGRMSGRKCQMLAISRWNDQSRRFSKNQDGKSVSDIKNELERLKEENKILKTWMLRYGSFPVPPIHCAHVDEYACKVDEIMKKFKEECEGHG